MARAIIGPIMALVNGIYQSIWDLKFTIFLLTLLWQHE